MVRFISTFLGLVAIWALLSGKFDILHFGLGVIGALVITYVIQPLEPLKIFPFFRFIVFVPWLLWQILMSNIAVAKIVLSRSMPIEPRFIRQKVKTKNDKGTVVTACSITLTPGTLTIDADEEIFLVHALDGNSASGVENDEIQDRVVTMFGEDAK